MTLSGTYAPSKQQWVRDQVAAYEGSGGTRANTLRETGDPIVVITSVGARSGNLRKNPVMRVERDGKYVAVASKGGAPDHPEWYHNFLAHPEVEVQDGAEPHTYSVRLLTGDERADWWDYAVATWPTYGKYQKKTDREIPVFLLERTD
jgi:F420H(2)-dependent quinone reductase